MFSRRFAPSNSPIWLRAFTNNASITTLEKRAVWPARLHFLCLLLAFTFIGYLIGAVHVTIISTEYCK